MAVAELGEEAAELRVVLLRHLDPREDSAVVRAVVAVVEEADVPVAPEVVEEVQERAGPLGELEPQQPLVCLLYTSPSPRDGLLSRMPSSA